MAVDTHYLMQHFTSFSGWPLCVNMQRFAAWALSQRHPQLPQLLVRSRWREGQHQHIKEVRRAGQGQRPKGKNSVPNLPLFPQWKAVVSLAVHEPLQRPSGHLPVSKASQGVLNVSGYFCDRGQGESSYLECMLSYEDKKIQFARFLEITFQESKEITIFSENTLNKGMKVLLQLCFCADHLRQIQFGGLP